MCASTYPTISLVYPMYNHLMDHAEKIMKDGKSSKSLVAAAKVAWNKLSEYYNKTSESVHYISTIIDPRWKLEYFRSWIENDDDIFHRKAKNL